MVKGISRQVIVVHSPEQKLFDQAIFILKDETIGKAGVTDEMLLKEADRLLQASPQKKRRSYVGFGILWALVGALSTGGIWLLCNLI